MRQKKSTFQYLMSDKSFKIKKRKITTQLKEKYNQSFQRKIQNSWKHFGGEHPIIVNYKTESKNFSLTI